MSVSCKRGVRYGVIVVRTDPDPSNMTPKAYTRRLEQDRKAHVEKLKALDAILKPLFATRFAR